MELTDPELEGKAERIGFEVSYKLDYRKGGPIRSRLAARCLGQRAYGLSHSNPIDHEDDVVLHE